MAEAGSFRLGIVALTLISAAAANAQGLPPPRVYVPPAPIYLPPSDLLLQRGKQNTPPPVQKAAPVDKPMSVSIVRLAQPGCEPNCIEWIAAEGRIENSTTAEFKRVFARLGTRKLPILIDSAGGSVDPGMAIGRLIRAKGLDVVVTKTVLTPCDAKDPDDAECRKLKAKGILLGKPEARISKCASSCAFILAGGTRRYVGPWTVVGLHEIKSISTMRLVQRFYRIEPRYGFGTAQPQKTLVREKTLSTVTSESPTDEKTYQRITKFFVEMGVDEQIMPILRSTPNSSIRWLRAGELRATNIATELINGEQLLLSPITANPSVAAIPAPSSYPTAVHTVPAATMAPPAASSGPQLTVRTVPPAASEDPSAPALLAPAHVAAPATAAIAAPPPTPITTATTTATPAPSQVGPPHVVPPLVAPVPPAPPTPARAAVVSPAGPSVATTPAATVKPKPKREAARQPSREERALPQGF